MDLNSVLGKESQTSCGSGDDICRDNDRRGNS